MKEVRRQGGESGILKTAKSPRNRPEESQAAAWRQRLLARDCHSRQGYRLDRDRGDAPPTNKNSW